ncbi:Dienelactone hydrolase [Bosea sp. 62]|nr:MULTISPECIES: dienelactone hydrolase [unclassified Bosea (in: a-proteobacteria)]CAD5295835.1 Dienelactone hydrolase [Bosea sp. 21B]CAD5296196.1 Dienelactone hydrolase [Bosea sp. 46]CAD5297824.1 Dienelactone hydrolase [Bosea sp. 7B]VVT61058.1 Predicted dienelactone hydrolase [Bosea sp. EC-HK365B]VXB12924.1 Dienelactone hydrolase [Bosea sp. 125]
MNLHRLLSSLAFCLATSLTQAAGLKSVDIPAEGGLQPLKGAIWYPCTQPKSEIRLGPFAMSVSMNCPLAGEKRPLIVVSHGRTGSFLGHRDTAEVLADAGFIVVAINHPGDTSLDQSRTREFSVFVERPADIKRVVDYILGSWPDAARIDAGRVGFFGFSRGGYTGLVAVGANPYFGKRLRLCEGKSDPLCDQVRLGELPELRHDPRIKAAVIADPLSVFFTQESFKNVRVPVQLWGSERGGDGVTPASVAEIAGWLPTKPDFHVVPGSQHFSFLPPCPAELAQSAGELCSDQPGFDRAAFHADFNARVLAFFKAQLGQPPYVK